VLTSGGVIEYWGNGMVLLFTILELLQLLELLNLSFVILNFGSAGAAPTPQES
jgi:hypothetical protein